MRKWDELVTSFTEECRIRGVGEATLLTRESELMRWGKWLKKKHKNIKIEDISQDSITDYIKSRTTFLSKSSTCGVMSSMRNFGEFLVSQGFWKNNPLLWMQGPKLNTNYRKIPKNYQKSDLKKIFEESFNGNLPYFRALNPALISLMYSTGLRKGELLGLNLSDWDRKNLTLKIYGQKTKQDRLVPVSSITWKCLENYIQKRNELLIKQKIQNEALFVNRNGERITSNNIHVQLKRIAKRAGVKRATAHMFRHSCATDLVEKGAPIHIVKNILGHSHIVTTFRYLNVADPERKKAMESHPINSILLANQENNHVQD